MWFFPPRGGRGKSLLSFAFDPTKQTTTEVGHDIAEAGCEGKP
jgi:hypothetical protein